MTLRTYTTPSIEVKLHSKISNLSFNVFIIGVLIIVWQVVPILQPLQVLLKVIIVDESIFPVNKANVYKHLVNV